MRRIVCAGLLAGVAGTAAAQATAPAVPEQVVTDLDTGNVTVIYDETLSEEFNVSRAIIDRVQAEFGEHAVYDNGDDLPDGIDQALVPGNTLPEDTPVAEVPEKLGDLPTLGEGTRWIAAGEHLVEVTPDNVIVMVLYDALP